MNLFACLYQQPSPDAGATAAAVLTSIAEDFSPRYERVGDDSLVFDASGLCRLFGTVPMLGEAIHQTTAARKVSVHVALAPTQTAAQILARAHDRVTIVTPAQVAHALAPLPLTVLRHLPKEGSPEEHEHVESTLGRWGLRSLGEVAALPRADLRTRLGAPGVQWQTLARGEDTRPLRPTRAEERFEGTLELEWPLESMEPLSFVLTRLLEPLSIQLERRGRGVATIHLGLRLVTKDTHWRHLMLPAPLRDPRTLRTLLLLDLETHPPTAGIDRVSITIDPTPAQIIQHRLFARAQPTPDQVSTLLARLGALMGVDRVGAPLTVDSDRPGAFHLRPFRSDWPASDVTATPSPVTPRIASALRRYRPPLPVRVALAANGTPAHITIDRAGGESGSVQVCAGPWKTSGAWWDGDRWNLDEWDVALASGTVYRLARDRNRNQWLLCAVAD